MKLDGKIFGNWTVIERDVSRPIGHQHPVYYICRCRCGTVSSVTADTLRRAKSKGCIQCRGYRISTAKIKHGYGTKDYGVYGVWQSMKQRCYNPRNKSFKNYGARGITICERWRTSFTNFLQDMGEPRPGQTLDRTNNDGPYSPENCQWTDRITQANNKRNNVRRNGKTLAQIARERGLNYKVFHKWIKNR